MSRYIDADALRRELIEIKDQAEKRLDNVEPNNIACRLIYTTQLNERDNLLSLVNWMPTADVVEVRRGEWEIKSRSYRMIDDFDEELYVECPFCKRTFYVPYEFDDEKTLAYARENYPYCHCGAKMDGERKDECESKK